MPCPFCVIAGASPPHSNPPILTSPQGSAYYVLSTPLIVAFLDIAPVSEGHVLVCPRQHREKATDITPEEFVAIGFWLPVLSRAIMRGLWSEGKEGNWNIIQANGAAAGQTIPHSHFHIIPRRAGTSVQAADIADAERQNLALGEGPRQKLSAADGERLSKLIKAEVAVETEKLVAANVISLGPAPGEILGPFSPSGLKL